MNKPSRVYDLSGPIENGADWYDEPGTNPVELTVIGSLERKGWESNNLKLMVLNGTTYMETAAHLFARRPTVDQVPVSQLVTRGFIVRLAGQGRVLPAPEEPLKNFESGRDTLVLASGWDSHWNQPDFYLDSPYFSKPLQDYILELNPAVLAGDMVSFDHPDDAEMPFLRTYFERGGMIVAPLYGLGDVDGDRVTLCVAPLRLVGASGAPFRVLAW